jgi:hypothetical protein
MKIDEKVNNRFQELIDLGTNIKSTRRSGGGTSIADLPYDFVDEELAHQWGINCLHILHKFFGNESDHYKRFDELFPKFSNSRSNFSAVKNILGILKAAKDDYENGYLFDTRALIEAEVFDDFLEQAEHLLNQGYFTAAAVIAGSVLEDGLRKLCLKNGITLSAKPKLDLMNADLAKAGVYNLLKQKQITALADLRNKAAHGLGGFTKEDVEGMVKDVRRFMVDYFS